MVTTDLTVIKIVIDENSDTCKIQDIPLFL